MGMNNKFNCINKFHSNLNSINFVKIFESIMKIFMKSQKMNICSYAVEMENFKCKQTSCGYSCLKWLAGFVGFVAFVGVAF